MEHLNIAAFLFLNAPANPGLLPLFVAKFFAGLPVWLIPSVLLMVWMRGDLPVRRVLLAATLAGLIGQSVNLGIGMLWQHPRPTALGLGHTFLAHAADSSFPSDHLTLMWSVAFSFMFYGPLRALGCLLWILAIPVAFSRIYLGVHFPFDMLGSLLVAAVSASLAFALAPLIVNPALPMLSRLYQTVFAIPIRKGWAMP